MRKSFVYTVFCVLTACMLAGCGPSPAEQRRAEKHVQDSLALVAQEKSLDYYQSQLDSLLPVADSLVVLFKYEPKNEKYQDHGYYLAKNADFNVWNADFRVLVRDDGHDLTVYKNGKRVEERKGLTAKEQQVVDRAAELQVVMRDIHELELRIYKTNLEIEKYKKRLLKSEN